MAGLNGFTRFETEVFKAAAKIPRGRVSTYAEIAKFVGSPKAARAVGNALNNSPGMPSCPCHRVVTSDGSVGGYAYGTKRKITLLRAEGITVKNGKTVGFKHVRFKF